MTGSAVHGLRGRRWQQMPGALIVFRAQMRARSAVRDLAAGLLLAAAAAALCAAGVWTNAHQSLLPGAVAADLTVHWTEAWFIVGTLLACGAAAALGAAAAPPAREFERTQAALLTRLTATDICLGRLLASLWPVVTAVLVSAAGWLIVHLVRPVTLPAEHGLAAILSAHCAVLCSVYLYGAIALAAALRRRPGRQWGRGALIGLAVLALCSSGIFLINPIVRSEPDPTSAIYEALLVNPVSAAATSADLDILRADAVYPHTEAPEYPFLYPSAWLSCALFIGLATTAVRISAARLRRAYR